jgi:MoaA/NifB/PqqE/SkfB family radical SAM enzyme
MNTQVMDEVGANQQQDWFVRWLENNETKLLKNKGLQRVALSYAEHTLKANAKENLEVKKDQPPGVIRDRLSMGMAILESVKTALNEYDLCESTLNALSNIVIKEMFLNKSLRKEKSVQFREEHGFVTPSFIVISPSKACNLRCTGCYADSNEKVYTLDWDLVNQIVKDARELWGTQFVVVSGGEPLAYRSKGKTILDIAEQNPDTFFMMYTNGTLIDDKVAARMAKLGNVLPAISLEGWREKTDQRRGEGVFDKVMAAMDRLQAAGVPYGTSLTATRQNAEEILSDDFIEFLFKEKHVVIGWVFQYMPIGRAFTTNLMPTPEQRLGMWQQSWKLIREKRTFLADFWNHGTVVDGCLSAGGHNNGGYFYIDWNGNVTPCVFVPFSPVNVNDIYSRGGNLNTIYDAPFFQRIRNWQKDDCDGNLLMPCLIRDHHKDLRHFIRDYEPDAIDSNAELTLIDPDYAIAMDQYAEDYRSLSEPIWEQVYLEGDPPELDTILS